MTDGWMSGIGSQDGLLRRRDFVRGSAGAAVGATMFGTLLSACGGSGTSAGGTMTLAGSAQATDTLNPFGGGSGDLPFASVIALYSGLTDQPFGTDLPPRPMLAESWKVSPDALTWTFNLRKATFHDGSELTSEDVAFTLRRILDPKGGSPLNGLMAPLLEESGIEAPDKRTVVLRLKEPGSYMAELLGDYTARVVKAGTTDFSKTATGTGPFAIKSFNPGRSYTFEKFEDFWQADRPYLGQLQFTASDDPASDAQAVVAGDVDVSAFLTPQLSRQYKQDPRGARLLTVKSSIWFNVYLDQTQEPWKDVRVVRAFKLAIDRHKVLDTLIGSNSGSVCADLPFPSSSKFYPPSLADPRQDAAAARQLLAEAGFPDGIDVTIDTSNAFSGMTDFAVVIAETTKEAGFRTKVNRLPDATYYETVGKKAPPAFCDYWAVRPSLVSMVRYFKTDSSLNVPHFSNREVDRVLTEAAATVDRDEQAALVHPAAEICSRDAGWIIPIMMDLDHLAAGDVEGVSGELDFTDARLES